MCCFPVITGTAKRLGVSFNGLSSCTNWNDVIKRKGLSGAAVRALLAKPLTALQGVEIVLTVLAKVFRLPNSALIARL